MDLRVGAAGRGVHGVADRALLAFGRGAGGAVRAAAGGAAPIGEFELARPPAQRSAATVQDSDGILPR